MSRYFRRKRYCRFTAEGIVEIDYKDIDLLKQNVTEIPITFYERADGNSKFTTGDALGFIDSFVQIILGLK